MLKDGRTPWYAKALLWFGVAYALLPFDVIPDFIPALGFVDDLLLAVLPIVLAVRFVPKAVVADARRLASNRGAFFA